MSRKDFEFIAEVISTMENEHLRTLTAYTFAARLRSTNINFNTITFLKACKVLSS